ncbi:uncharacterized protein N0V89_002866 [Didymosphaeria variabile]|uniref:Uncharacterized protein n=1 Tax=Didymosphaeria variabile TaxID=1932322 RepID=A0A9W8XTB1_9PLEO|nr:uncharacterized protein N0V89_002866 [Didymosphaeria variabile]KAJ4358286.1 hypothetical protein N0V89_002866 [Didymosphaeria variabile]
MRFEGLSSLALFALAASHAIEVRAPAEAAVAATAGDHDNGKDWHPHTKEPHFFNLRVNDRCDPFHRPQPETLKSQCPFDSYAIRLEKGILVATPYNKWYDPKLPTFFVDDDTQLYTVSKDPLQLYVDSVTGAVKYTKVGWLPPSAISTGFYHTGNNPIQLVDPSPSYLTWPSTYGITKGGNFAICPLGSTGQYQVFVNNWNFDQQGVEKRRCKYYALAALNANPWKKEQWRLKARDDYPTSDDDSYPTWGDDSGDSWSDDSDDSWSDDDDSWGKDSKDGYKNKDDSYETKDPGYKTKDPGYETDDGYETKDPGYDTWEKDDPKDDGYKQKDDSYDTSDEW